MSKRIDYYVIIYSFSIIMDKKHSLLTKWTDINVVSMHECVYCSEQYPLYDLEKQQYDKQWFIYSDHCALCNFKLLNTYLNDKHLYSRKDSQTGKNIISLYSEAYKWKVIDAHAYKKLISDDIWLKFGKETSDNMFWDFISLMELFPKPSRLIYPQMENAEYASHAGRGKNFYLSYCVFTECEDIYYSQTILDYSKNVISSYSVSWGQYIYNSCVIIKSFNIMHSYNCVNSSNIYFSHDMNNCKECIFSCNQVNQSYIIFNKQYEEVNYEKNKKEILDQLKDSKSFDFLVQKYSDFLNQNYISESVNTNNCEGVNGEKTFFSKNSVNTFGCNSVENTINCGVWWDGINDSCINVINAIETWWDVDTIIWTVTVWMSTSNIFYSYAIVEACSHIYYSIDLETCEECLFCIWLKSKKYCILNKQYSKWEYFERKEKIINQLQAENKWWKSLDFWMLWFPYNDTLAYDYFWIQKIIHKDWTKKIIDKNAKWIVTLLGTDFITDAILDLWGKEKINITWRTCNKEINIPDNFETIHASELISIDEVGEDILNKVIICEESGRPFRIMPDELKFYKKHWLALPRIHHELRMEKHLNNRSHWELYVDSCDKCDSQMLTVYKSKPKFKVYCPDCYKKFMYT